MKPSTLFGVGSILVALPILAGFLYAADKVFGIWGVLAVVCLVVGATLMALAGE